MSFDLRIVLGIVLGAAGTVAAQEPVPPAADPAAPPATQQATEEATGHAAPRADPEALAEILTREQMAADLAQLADVAQRSWAYAEDRREHFGVDLAELRDRFTVALPEAATRAEFAATLEEFVASLQDGHAWVDVPGVVPAETRYWPCTLADTTDGVVIAGARDSADGGAAEHSTDGAEPTAPPGVRVGDVVLAVEGEPVEDAIARLARRIPASTDGARRVFALRRLRRTGQPSVTLVVRDPDAPSGETRERSVELPTVVGAGEDGGPDQGPVSELRWLADDVACLRVGSFTVPDFDRFVTSPPEEQQARLEDAKVAIAARVAEAASARALVLDLRGNSGGTDWLGIALAEQLVPGRFLYFRLQQRNSPEAAALSEWIPPEPGWGPASDQFYGSEGRVPPFRGRVVLLIDEEVFSTADNFVACVADQHPDRAVVGRPTHGGSGAPRRLVTLTHSGAAVTLTTMQVSRAAGGLIEGRGTRPDVLVRPSRADVMTGRDADLAAALAAARVVR